MSGSQRGGYQGPQAVPSGPPVSLAVFQQAVAGGSVEKPVFLLGQSLGKAMGPGTQGTTGAECVSHVLCSP